MEQGELDPSQVPPGPDGNFLGQPEACQHCGSPPNTPPHLLLAQNVTKTALQEAVKRETM